MNIIQHLVLSLVQKVDNPAADLTLLPLLRRLLAPDGAQIVEFARHTAWQARWAASQEAVHYLSPEETWQLLCRLAEDPERNVREGAAHGLGNLLSQAPNQLMHFQAVLTDSQASDRLKRAVLNSAVVLWRTHSEQLEASLSLVTTAAGEPALGPYRTIGSHLLKTELSQYHPEHANRLLQQWSAEDNPNLRYHAARAAGSNAKPPCIEEFNPAWQSTAELPVSAQLIDQVIGQERAVEIIRIAARQRRFVLLLGDPGTGKSMLAQAMAHMMPAKSLQDLLTLPNDEQPISPRILSVPAGQGMLQLFQARQARRQAEGAINFVWWVLLLGLGIVGGVLTYIYSNWVYLAISAGVLLFLLWLRPRLRPSGRWIEPKILVQHGSQESAPFVDATGFHAGALLGDVRHDPFQSGGSEAPPHQLVEPGAIHLAHGGVLFIDEVSTLSTASQQQLLSAIQDKQLAITGRSPGSSGSMVRSEPVPCDFVLVLAGNREDIENMHPALRSRIRGYGYEIVTASEMVDTPANRQRLIQFVAQEVRKDGKIPHFSRPAVEAVIEEATRRATQTGHLSLHLRELGGLIRAAGDLAVIDQETLVSSQHVANALLNSRSLEEQISDRAPALNSTHSCDKGQK